MDLMDKDLSLNYLSHCDPRLNYEQSLGESLPLLRGNVTNDQSIRCRILDLGLPESKEKGHRAKGCFVGGAG